MLFYFTVDKGYPYFTPLKETEYHITALDYQEWLYYCNTIYQGLKRL